MSYRGFKFPGVNCIFVGKWLRNKRAPRWVNWKLYNIPYKGINRIPTNFSSCCCFSQNSKLSSPLFCFILQLGFCFGEFLLLLTGWKGVGDQHARGTVTWMGSQKRWKLQSPKYPCLLNYASLNTKKEVNKQTYLAGITFYWATTSIGTILIVPI